MTVNPAERKTKLSKHLMQMKVIVCSSFTVGMFTVNRLTENFRLTGLSVNRTETGNMATSKKAVI